MEHLSLDQVRAHASVTRASPAMTRRQRLRRWADRLEALGSRPLEPLRQVELYAEPERRRLRRDGSAISIAFADPVLRDDGLRGDTLGDAQTFFGLSDNDAHRLLCDCLQQRPTGRSIGRRLRALTRGGLFALFWG
jgi:hypothetical protein